MKAVVCEKYGPPEVLELKEKDKPVPKDYEVLVKVHASTVNAADCNVRGLTYIPPGLGFLAKSMLGFKKPKISVLGSVLAMEIEAAGKEVLSLRPSPGVKKWFSEGGRTAGPGKTWSSFRGFWKQKNSGRSLTGVFPWS
jgi:NADPH:quinone reductase-like Zn-dependent oxidoreductase